MTLHAVNVVSEESETTMLFEESGISSVEKYCLIVVHLGNSWLIFSYLNRGFQDLSGISEIKLQNAYILYLLIEIYI